MAMELPKDGDEFTALSFTRETIIEEARVAAGDAAADRVAQMQDAELEDLAQAIGEYLTSYDFHLHALEHLVG